MTAALIVVWAVTVTALWPRLHRTVDQVMPDPRRRQLDQFIHRNEVR